MTDISDAENAACEDVCIACKKLRNIISCDLSPRFCDVIEAQELK